MRYVSLDPVRARDVAKAEDWAWSSVRTHLWRRDDELVRVAPVLARVQRFEDLLASDADDPGFKALRASEGNGRALDNADFIAGLKRIL